jgi:HD-like signal output (HDOD) protein
MHDNPEPAAPFPHDPRSSRDAQGPIVPPRTDELERLSEAVVGLFEDRKLELPVLPSSVANLIALCGGELPDMDAIAHQVALDQSLCAHVLRLANSAGFAPVDEIDSVPEAVRRLGTRVIADLAISSMLQESLCTGSCADTRAHLQRAAVAGVYSLHIGHRIGEARSASLLPGLLHDIGRPLATSLFSGLESLEGGELPSEAIAFLIDDLHVLIGLRLVREWNLPRNLETAIRFHENPGEAPEGTREAHIANLASLLATWTLTPEATEGIVLPELEVVRQLGLSDADLAALFTRLGEAREAANAFA